MREHFRTIFILKLEIQIDIKTKTFGKIYNLQLFCWNIEISEFLPTPWKVILYDFPQQTYDILLADADEANLSPGTESGEVWVVEIC